jgi:hypothetical protein
MTTKNGFIFCRPALLKMSMLISQRRPKTTPRCDTRRCRCSVLHIGSWWPIIVPVEEGVCPASCMFKIVRSIVVGTLQTEGALQALVEGGGIDPSIIASIVAASWVGDNLRFTHCAARYRSTRQPCCHLHRVMLCVIQCKLNRVHVDR